MANKIGELSYEIILNDSNFQSSLAKFKEETKNVTTSTTAWMQTLGSTTEKQLSALNRDWLKNQQVLSDSAIASGVSTGTIIKNIDAIANPAQRAQAAFYNAQIGIMNSTKGSAQAVAQLASATTQHTESVKQSVQDKLGNAFHTLQATSAVAMSAVANSVDKAKQSIAASGSQVSTSIKNFMKFDAGSSLSEAQTLGSKMGSMMGNAIRGSLIAGGSLLAGLGGVLVKGFNIGKELQTTRATLDVQLGSKDAGKKLFGDLQAYAAKTPFETVQLAQAATTLKGFGVTAEKLVPTLKQLGNASAGNSERLQGIATVTGQIVGLGKLQGQDILQLINNGVPIYEALRAQTGKTTEELKKLGSEGKISSETYLAALNKLYGEGGKLGNLAEEQSRTLVGLQSTAGESFKLMLASIAGFEEDGYLKIGGLAEKISIMLENFNKPENQAKVTEIGNKISDFVIKAVAKIGELITKTDEWWKQNKDDVIPIVTNVASVIGSVVSGLGLFFTQIISNQAALTTFTISMTALAFAINPIGMIIATIVGLTGYWIARWPLMKEGLLAIGDAAKTGFSYITSTFDGWKIILDKLIAQVNNFADGWKKIGSTISDKASSTGDFFKGIFKGKAVGGPVSGGTPYIVGERGPEMFVPSTSGSIIPNHALSDGSGGRSSVTINMSGAYMLSTADDKRRFAQELQTVLAQANGLNYAS